MCVSTPNDVDDVYPHPGIRQENESSFGSSLLRHARLLEDIAQCENYNNSGDLFIYSFLMNHNSQTDTT